MVWWKERLQFMLWITDNVIKKLQISAPKWVLTTPSSPSCTFLRLLLILLFSRAVPALSLGTGGDRYIGTYLSFAKPTGHSDDNGN